MAGWAQEDSSSCCHWWPRALSRPSADANVGEIHFHQAAMGLPGELPCTVSLAIQGDTEVVDVEGGQAIFSGAGFMDHRQVGP